MNTTTIIGITASVFSAISMLPQLITIIKKREAKNISVLMLLVLITGLSLWIVYGVLLKDPILICANSFSVLLNTTILILTIKFQQKI